MDIEFHYYITYILAKKAGFKKGDAAVIAYSSQYTDDNCTQYYVNSLLHGDFMSKPSQTMDIIKPSVKKISIYPVFHFFPGNPDSPTAARKDGEKHAFNTTPDSKNVRRIFVDALKTGNCYRIGIATHVYADSWAHQNFLGLEDEFNAAVIKEKSILNIGHATFLHNPDIVGRVWTDGRLVKENEKIDNNERFIDAAEKIFHAYKRHLVPKVSDAEILRDWSGVRDDLRRAMSKRSLLGDLFDLSRKKRIRAYRRIGTDIPPYDKNEWRHEAVFRAECEADIFDCYWAKEKFRKSRWYGYQQAVRSHYNVSMKVLERIYRMLDPIITRHR